MNAILWIDSDGKFKVENFDSVEEAEKAADITSESGYPVAVFNSRDFIHAVVNGEL